MGPFPSSFGNLYILLVIDYVPKWIEVKAILTSEAKVVLDFVIQKLSLVIVTLIFAIMQLNHYYASTM
jgi:hypothetical protein